MTAILYYLIIKPISMLPHWWLYRISDLLFLLFFHLSGYRKKVVMTNLTKSFPEKNEKEVKELARKFYRHFCDLIVETVKNFSISREAAMKRMRTINPELCKRFAQERQHIIVAAGHNNNWELWAMAAPDGFAHELVAVYKPLSNPWLDRKLRQSRQKYGMRMIPMTEANTELDTPGVRPKALVLAIDQNPGNARRAYWMRFLHQDTAVLFGTELYSKRYGIPVVYGHLKKVKRGFYEVTYELFTEDGSRHSYGEVTRGMTEILEKDIIAEPEFWLWSHKRWKHRLPDGRSLHETQPPH